MKAGVKAGLLSFCCITILYYLSYTFKLYQINSIFNFFPLSIPPFLGVFFTVKQQMESSFIDRLKGGIQSSLIAGLLFAITAFVLIKLRIIQHELINANNLFINFGMTINIFAVSGAFLGAIFSALLYKKK